MHDDGRLFGDAEVNAPLPAAPPLTPTPPTPLRESGGEAERNAALVNALAAIVQGRGRVVRTQMDVLRGEPRYHRLRVLAAYHGLCVMYYSYCQNVYR